MTRRFRLVVPFHPSQDEQLVITITKQSASTRAYTAAGGSQIAPFFAADGYGATNPGSALSLSIYPSYYSGVKAVRPVRIRNRIPPRDTAHGHRHLQHSTAAETHEGQRLLLKSPGWPDLETELDRVSQVASEGGSAGLALWSAHRR